MNDNSIKPSGCGVSFSLKYCDTLELDWRMVLQASIDELSFARYRLMSYWDVLCPQKGEYDFADLDTQIEMVGKSGRKVSLCLGVRQPRWPESHVPQWAQELLRSDSKQYADEAVKFVEMVVKRYKDSNTIESYQLENEALNRGIGVNHDFSRDRLKREFTKVKDIDSKTPIIMSTSNNVGIPMRNPKPDIVGFSMYMSQHDGKQYESNKIPLWWHALRKNLISQPVIIHELQAEPWGPKSTELLSLEEQKISMNPDILRANLERAGKLGIGHVDLWGLEWWYWLRGQGDQSMWDFVHSLK